MRRPLALLGVALVAIGIAVTSATAQDEAARDEPVTTLSADVEMTPTRAGTRQRPRAVTLGGTAKIVTEPGFDPPIVTGVDIYVGHGLSWNGDDYVTCSKRVLDSKGPKGCPQRSIMGSGVATARADTVNTRIDVVMVNGGSKTLYAHASLTNPARVQETVVVKTTAPGGRWRYRDSFTIPKSLQVVAGVPIQVTGMTFSLGGRSWAREYITSTSCPSGGWRYKAVAHYLFDLSGKTSEDTITGTVPCRS
jgi:hypothetical protein